MLTPLFRVTLRLFAKPFLGRPFPVGFQRRWAAMLTSIQSVARGTSFKLVNMDGVPARLIAAEDASEQVVLFFHGGAYILGNPQSHRGLLSHLANKAKAQVYAVDYRLAPEHVYPAALDDALCAYRWLLEAGYEAANITVAGDSAGGGLAVATINAIRDEQLPMPGKAVLISPFVDLTVSGTTAQSKAKADPMLRVDWLRDSGDLYRGSTAADDPGCSPLFADLSAFPDTLIHVGSEEILLDDSQRLKDKLDASGGTVRMRVFDNMWHDFQLEAGLIPEADESVDEMARFISHRA